MAGPSTALPPNEPADAANPRGGGSGQVGQTSGQGRPSMTPDQRATTTEERRAGARLAGGAWTLGLLLALASLVLTFLSRSYPETADSIPLFARQLMFVPSTLAFLTAGALIAARRPRNPIGWLLLASGMVDSLGGVAEGYWRYALVVQPGALPGGRVMLWVNTRPYELSVIFAMLLVLLFPT